jgi:hypothetical protein
MPKPPASAVYRRTRREPLPLRLKEYPRERRPSRAGFWVGNRNGDDSQGRCHITRDERHRGGAANIRNTLWHALARFVRHKRTRTRRWCRHTNKIEHFWSIFKRGVVSTFHKASAKDLPLFVAEFQFRYNNRENADIFGAAISGC